MSKQIVPTVLFLTEKELQALVEMVSWTIEEIDFAWHPSKQKATLRKQALRRLLKKLEEANATPYHHR
jgi:glyoxylate utilization-related uncharacterized protein